MLCILLASEVLLKKPTGLFSVVIKLKSKTFGILLHETDNFHNRIKITLSCRVDRRCDWLEKAIPNYGSLLAEAWSPGEKS